MDADGDALLEGSMDCYVRSDDVLTTVVGLQNAVVVIGDAVLAMHRDRAQYYGIDADPFHITLFLLRITRCVKTVAYGTGWKSTFNPTHHRESTAARVPKQAIPTEDYGFFWSTSLAVPGTTGWVPGVNTELALGSPPALPGARLPAAPPPVPAPVAELPDLVSLPGATEPVTPALPPVSLVFAPVTAMAALTAKTYNAVLASRVVLAAATIFRVDISVPLLEHWFLYAVIA